MSYERKLTKSKVNGWTATTEVLLENFTYEGEPAQRYLKFKTWKGNGRVDTMASVSVVQDTGRGYSREVSAVFQDYYKIVARHDIKTATEKAISDAHASVVHLFTDHVKAAKEQYNIKD